MRSFATPLNTSPCHYTYVYALAHPNTRAHAHTYIHKHIHTDKYTVTHRYTHEPTKKRYIIENKTEKEMTCIWWHGIIFESLKSEKTYLDTYYYWDIKRQNMYRLYNFHDYSAVLWPQFTTFRKMCHVKVLSNKLKSIMNILSCIEQDLSGHHMFNHDNKEDNFKLWKEHE